MMESNTIATRAAAGADLTHPSATNQAHQAVPNMVGQEGEVLGSTSSPQMEYNRNAYPYGLPPNYTPPTMHENVHHAILVTFEGQQTQPAGGPCEEPREHAQGDFDPYPPFTAKGSAFNTMPQLNTTGASQPHP